MSTWGRGWKETRSRILPHMQISISVSVSDNCFFMQNNDMHQYYIVFSTDKSFQKPHPLNLKIRWRQHLAEAINDKNCQLRKLNLSFNHHIRKPGKLRAHNLLSKCMLILWRRKALPMYVENLEIDNSLKWVPFNVVSGQIASNALWK